MSVTTFNPTLVQFKPYILLTSRGHILFFQSYLSPIQTVDDRLLADGEDRFQSYLSPIQTEHVAAHEPEF